MVIITYDGTFIWAEEESLNGRDIGDYTFHRDPEEGPAELYYNYRMNTITLNYFEHNQHLRHLTQVYRRESCVYYPF